MIRYAIGAEKLFDQLASSLDKGFNELRLHQIEVITGRFRLGTIWYYTVEWKKGDLEQLRSLLVKEIANFITLKWERKQIEQNLAEEYPYYDADEVDYLADNTVKLLSYHRTAGARDFRKKEIENEIYGYLAEHGILNIEGFIKFRLRMYQNDRIRAMEQAIDDYLMDREHHEFVKLLRYFLQAQEPRSPLIHLVVKREWARLIDHDGLLITNEDLEEFTEDLLDNDIQQEDVIISTLITLAPEKVMIHMPHSSSEEQVLADTVKRVFENRAQVCSGCTLCQTPLELWDRMDVIPLDHLQ